MATITIRLNAGWNSVYIPWPPVNPRVEAVFPDALVVYWWSEELARYVQVAVVEPKKTYWVAVTYDAVYIIEVMAWIFRPGETKTAKVTFTNPKAKTMNYEGKLFMGANMTLMAEAAFSLNAGQSKEVLFSVRMPSVASTYPVYVGVFSDSVLIPPYYRATGEVGISAEGAPVTKWSYDYKIHRWNAPRSRWEFFYIICPWMVRGAPYNEYWNSALYDQIVPAYYGRLTYCLRYEDEWNPAAEIIEGYFWIPASMLETADWTCANTACFTGMGG